MTKFHDEAVSPRGETLVEKTVASDLGVKTPLIVGLSSELIERGLIDEDNREKVETCFEEVFTNAIVHGNECDRERKVRARLFRDGEIWGLQVTDEGAGFSPDRIPDPEDPEFPWMEHGRGVHMMNLIADEVEFFSGGRTVVLTWNPAAQD
ncbi:MAG: ATP-binding protein [Planctomycetes bacterium]|nr:ATP-binding protein [Planctomycetota bacterium]